MIYFGCPKCGAALAAPESQAGQTETCPECGNVAAVPTATATVATVPARLDASVFDGLTLDERTPEQAAIAQYADDLAAVPARASVAAATCCPRCHTEQTQKVSIAYMHGTRLTHASASGYGMGSNGMMAVMGGGAGVSQSLLAADLSPPRQRPDHGVLLTLVGLILGFVLALWIGSAYDAPTIWPAPVAQLGLGGLVAVCFLVSGMISSHNATAHNRWAKHALPTWNLSWVCLRCGAVFIPAGRRPSLADMVSCDVP